MTLSTRVRRILASFSEQGYTVEAGPIEACIFGPGCEGRQGRPGQHVTYTDADGVRLNGVAVGLRQLRRRLSYALRLDERRAR